MNNIAKSNEGNNIVAPIFPQVEGKIQAIDNESDIIFPQAGGKLETEKIILIPWGHQKTIIDKCKSVKQALFYIAKTIENNWSRAVLEYQIETDLYSRQGKAVTNFNLTTAQSVKMASFGEAKTFPILHPVRGKKNISLILHPVRDASFGKNKNTPQTLHSVRNATY